MISMVDVIFTFIILALLFSLVNVFYTSLKVFRQTNVAYHQLRIVQAEQNVRIKKIFDKSLVQIDELNRNMARFQLNCVLDSRKKCEKCKDCPYGRGAK